MNILEIVQTVSQQYGLHPDDIHEDTRRQDILIARQVCMYLAHKYTLLSTTKIGLAIGNKNHSTVIHAYKTIQNRLDVEKAFRKQVESIEEIIKSGMDKKKVYISGMISGMPLQYVKEKFSNAAIDLKKAGYVPINPLDNGLDEKETWGNHMKADLKLMLDCDMVYLLPDWMNSKGATIEKNLAEALGIKCITKIECYG